MVLTIIAGREMYLQIEILPGKGDNRCRLAVAAALLRKLVAPKGNHLMSRSYQVIEQVK